MLPTKLDLGRFKVIQYGRNDYRLEDDGMECARFHYLSDALANAKRRKSQAKAQIEAAMLPVAEAAE